MGRITAAPRGSLAGTTERPPSSEPGCGASSSTARPERRHTTFYSPLTLIAPCSRLMRSAAVRRPADHCLGNGGQETQADRRNIQIDSASAQTHILALGLCPPAFRECLRRFRPTTTTYAHRAKPRRSTRSASHRRSDTCRASADSNALRTPLGSHMHGRHPRSRPSA